ncbi:MAG: hypothetical protein IK104_03090 [Clostridia bacterium]|nr:hypothetical protein [Clostridia bacterium]
MRESSASALGGVLAALSVSIMLLTYISPLMVYAAPAFAGLFILVIQVEAGRGWALGEYAAVGLLSLFLIADKEAAVFYLTLFGLYPIVRDVIETHVKPFVLRLLLKLLVVNCSMVLAFLLCLYVLGVSYEDLLEHGWVYVVVFILMMDVMMLVYDFLLGKLQALYVNRLRKKVRRLFK